MPARRVHAAGEYRLMNRLVYCRTYYLKCCLMDCLMCFLTYCLTYCLMYCLMYCHMHLPHILHTHYLMHCLMYRLAYCHTPCSTYCLMHCMRATHRPTPEPRGFGASCVQRAAPLRLLQHHSLTQWRMQAPRHHVGSQKARWGALKGPGKLPQGSCVDDADQGEGCALAWGPIRADVLHGGKQRWEQRQKEQCWCSSSAGSRKYGVDVRRQDTPGSRLFWGGSVTVSHALWGLAVCIRSAHPVGSQPSSSTTKSPSTTHACSMHTQPPDSWHLPAVLQ